MQQVRATRQSTGSAALAAITNHTEDREPHHLAMLRRGAECAAAALGYQLEIFRVRLREQRHGSLQEILRSQNVEGVLILPLARAVRLTRYLDWERFAVVAATPEGFAPEFHRVAPDQFGNTLCLCEQLAAAGRRRLGYVTAGSSDLVAERRFATALNWLNTVERGSALTLSLYAGHDRSKLREWFDRQRPDAIIAETEQEAEGIAAELGAARRRRVMFALNEHAGSPRWSGIDGRFRAIGAAAIGQLHARIHAGEKGIPAVPTVMTIKGQWIEATAADAPADVPVAI